MTIVNAAVADASGSANACVIWSRQMEHVGMCVAELELNSTGPLIIEQSGPMQVLTTARGQSFQADQTPAGPVGAARQQSKGEGRTRPRSQRPGERTTSGISTW